MNKILATVLAVAFVLGIMFGVYYGLWCLWTWVMPQFFPSANEAIIRPNLWLFIGAWFLVSMIGKSIFGSKENS